MTINRRMINKERLLNYITYASDEIEEIDVDDLLEFIEARSTVLLTSDKDNKNMRERELLSDEPGVAPTSISNMNIDI